MGPISLHENNDGLNARVFASTVAQVLNLCFTMNPNSLLLDAWVPTAHGKSALFFNRRYIQMVDSNGWKNPTDNTSKGLNRYIQ